MKVMCVMNRGAKEAHSKCQLIFMLRVKVSAAKAAIRLKPTVPTQMANFLEK
jgi:hypothetical protein